MRTAVGGFVAAAVLAGGMALVAGRTGSTAHDPQQARPEAPLAFEANVGQADPAVRFLAHAGGSTILLGATEAVLPDAHLTFPGANTNPTATAAAPLPGTTNYFPEADPATWRTNVAHHALVTYSAVWPGVDVAFYGTPRHLEYDFVVAPGTDPATVRFGLETGTGPVHVDRHGNLAAADGTVVQGPPTVYQDLPGGRRPVTAAYRILGDGTVMVAAGAYDRTKPLVIDPVLGYSTYLGGGSTDVANAIAVDGSGNAYVTGTTNSGNFPLASALRTQFAPSFVTKYDASGAVVYSTYFGASCCVTATAIAVDSAGGAHITGYTNNGLFPTVNPIQSQDAGGTDAFVAKLSPSGGAVEWATFLGGKGGDAGAGIAVDANGNVYVTGSTSSDDFPTVAAFQPGKGANATDDAFVTKITAGGGGLSYSSYLGGAATDRGGAIAVDANGNAFVTGHTQSADFNTAAPFQPSIGNSGSFDAFVAKVGSGGGLAWSSYLGGAAEDIGTGIATDGNGNAYVTGYTSSSGFPTLFPLQPTKAINEDAFVTKVSAGGTITYSTFLGGNGSERARAIAVDGSGRAFVTGSTTSTNLATVDAVQGTIHGNQDAFVASLNGAGSALNYLTYLGGGLAEEAFGIDVASDGTAYVAGRTASSDFPTAGAAQGSPGGGGDAFVSRISPPSTGPTTTSSSSTTTSSTTTTAPPGSTTTTSTPVVGPLGSICAVLQTLANNLILRPILQGLLALFHC